MAIFDKIQDKLIKNNLQALKNLNFNMSDKNRLIEKTTKKIIRKIELHNYCFNLYPFLFNILTRKKKKKRKIAE